MPFWHSPKSTLQMPFGIWRVERKRNLTFIDCGYHVGFRLRSTRPTHPINVCDKNDQNA